MLLVAGCALIVFISVLVFINCVESLNLLLSVFLKCLKCLYSILSAFFSPREKYLRETCLLHTCQFNPNIRIKR